MCDFFPVFIVGLCLDVVLVTAAVIPAQNRASAGLLLIFPDAD